MDEYGSFGPNDLEEIAQAFMAKENIVFAYSPNKIDSYIISLNRDFHVLGIIPFGGNPRGRIWVSVYGKGCNHFSVDEFPDYIQEKLRCDDLLAESISRILAVLHE